MWLLYAALVVIAGVAFGFGVVPVGIIALVLVALVAGGAALSRARTMHIETTDSPEGIPGSREAAAETQLDPNRTPTGSTTGTP
jgi:hypothetical protein